jgi:uncharacterized protein (TIGR02466 family)
VNLQPIFCSFLVADIVDLDLDLENHCYDVIRNENIKRNDSIPQSSFLDLKDSKFAPLISTVSKKFNQLHNELGLSKLVSQIVSEYWININLNEKISFPHSHPNRLFSAVYYVKAEKNCGDLVFMNPNKVVCQNVTDDCISEYNFYNATHWKVSPEKNLLIIFPSWLDHYVMPNLSGTDRISIAFNSRMLYQD